MLENTHSAAAAVAVEHAVTFGVLVVGAALAAWYLATGFALLACAAARGLGRRWHLGETAVRTWGAPLLRRSFSAAAGLALGAGLGLAHATDTSPPALPADLGWIPVSEAASVTGPAAVGPAASDLAASDPAAAAEASSRQTGTRVVRAGDSLWAIAAADLADRGLAPDARAVAALWPRWYAANRAVVGPDPHLIHPGQELQPPTEGAPR